MACRVVKKCISSVCGIVIAGNVGKKRVGSGRRVSRACRVGRKRAIPYGGVITRSRVGIENVNSDPDVIIARRISKRS